MPPIFPGGIHLVLVWEGIAVTIGLVLPHSVTDTHERAPLSPLRLACFQAFHRTHYRPDNAHLYIVGDVDVDQAEDLIRKYFGHLESPTVAQPHKQVSSSRHRPFITATALTHTQDSTTYGLGNKQHGVQAASLVCERWSPHGRRVSEVGCVHV
jgi:hypothetical protein